MAALLAFLAGAVLAADTPSHNALLTLINTRSAGKPKEYEEAAKIVLADAQAGKPLQQFVIALASQDPDAPRCARIGDSLRREFLAASRPKIKALAERRNNSLAWYLLAVESNDHTILKKAVDAGNIQAMNAWGTMKLNEALNTPLVDTNELQNIYMESYRCFKSTADSGDPNGCYNLGMCYMSGYGVEPNAAKAMECFLAAAKHGHPEAINNLGGFYRDGIVVAKDPVRAAKMFAKSADFGNAYGELNYALALLRGEGVEKDEERAARMLCASARKGNLEAINAYGECLFRGTGVKKDYPEAFKWFNIAARRGFAPAMENYAMCLESGIGGAPKDFNQATVWRIRARALRGDRNATAWLIQNGHDLR